MYPKDAVAELEASPQNTTLKKLCKESCQKNQTAEIENLVKELDKIVVEKRELFSGSLLTRFERLLFREMFCYCMLSDLLRRKLSTSWPIHSEGASL